MYSFRMATDVFLLLLLLHFGRSSYYDYCFIYFANFHSDYLCVCIHRIEPSGCIDNSANSVSIELGRLIYALPTIK